jgi:hypothetical protein
MASVGTSKASTTPKIINFFIVPPFNFGKRLPVSPFHYHLTTDSAWFLSHLLSVTGFIHGHIKLSQSVCQQKIAKKCMVVGIILLAVSGSSPPGARGLPIKKMAY